MPQHHPITRELLASAYTYETYWQLIQDLLAQGKTTGENHSPEMIKYTELNTQRSRRIDEHVPLSPALQEALAAVDEGWTWLVITEWWCGDAAQNVPILAKAAAASPHIDFRLILRDEHPQVMDAYLTNGGRSIPILVCLRTTDLAQLGTWGPRPAEAQAMVMDFKANPEQMSYKEMVQAIHTWYGKNKTAQQQAELAQKVNGWRIASREVVA